MASTTERAERALPRPVIWRVTDRGTFAEMRRHGRRARRGPVSVSWMAPAPDAAANPPRVAFAVGKATGNSVVRNRVRRRLRAVLRDLRRDSLLPAGTYLLSGRPEVATLPYPELVAAVSAAVSVATSPAQAGKA